jgi:hypothetical protein
MEYVNLGSTGLKVSRICLGTMTYGSKKWREWVLEDAEARPFPKFQSNISLYQIISGFVFGLLAQPFVKTARIISRHPRLLGGIPCKRNATLAR